MGLLLDCFDRETPTEEGHREVLPAELILRGSERYGHDL